MTTVDYSGDYYSDPLTPEIKPIHIGALVLYALVLLVGVLGNAVVVWVTAFCMPRTVTSLWFLNLAAADLLCCLSLALLMVPLVHDDHWHFGAAGCTLIKSVFYLLMLCSVLQLVLISLDRWILVSRPIWCQNHRRPWMAAAGCAAVWLLALIGSIPQFVYTREIRAGTEKKECVTVHSPVSGWLVTSYRFLVGFLIPLLVIVACHWVVYRRAQSGLSQSQSRSQRTLRVIVAVVVSFFLCWLPLHVVNFLTLVIPRTSSHSPRLYSAEVLTLCLAYFNSCLNPLLYVCMGKGFKDGVIRSLRNILNFMSEDPPIRASASHDTKFSNTDGNTTKV